MVTAKKKTVPPWLSSSQCHWHALQRRCQPTPAPIYISCFTASVLAEANHYIYIYIYIRGGGQIIKMFPWQGMFCYFPSQQYERSLCCPFPLTVDGRSRQEVFYVYEVCVLLYFVFTPFWFRQLWQGGSSILCQGI